MKSILSCALFLASLFAVNFTARAGSENPPSNSCDARLDFESKENNFDFLSESSFSFLRESENDVKISNQSNFQAHLFFDWASKEMKALEKAAASNKVDQKTFAQKRSQKAKKIANQKRKEILQKRLQRFARLITTCRAPHGELVEVTQLDVNIQPFLFRAIALAQKMRFELFVQNPILRSLSRCADKARMQVRVRKEQIRKSVRSLKNAESEQLVKLMVSAHDQGLIEDRRLRLCLNAVTGE